MFDDDEGGSGVDECGRRADRAFEVPGEAANEVDPAEAPFGAAIGRRGDDEVDIEAGAARLAARDDATLGRTLDNPTHRCAVS